MMCDRRYAVRMSLVAIVGCEEFPRSGAYMDSYSRLTLNCRAQKLLMYISAR